MTLDLVTDSWVLHQSTGDRRVAALIGIEKGRAGSQNEVD